MKQDPPRSPGDPPSPRHGAAAWAVSLGAGALITFLVTRYRLNFALSGTEQVRLYGCLSDGAFTAAVVLLGVGLLVRVSATGFFDMLSYGLQGLWHRLLSFLHPKGQEPYYDYKQKKRTKRRGVPLALLISGAFYLALAVVMLLLYRRG